MNNKTQVAVLILFLSVALLCLACENEAIKERLNRLEYQVSQPERSKVVDCREVKGEE